MITNQFSLGGTYGSYPIYDFNMELNYERPSQITITTDSDLVHSLSSETFMQFYYLDNPLFKGVPIYGSKNNDKFEIILMDKIASLWTVGGFAISGGTGELEYKNRSAYEIVYDILNGSQFYVTPQTIPSDIVSVSGSWLTKPDFLYSIAKQIIDSNGNMATVWVDDKNYVHIGALNGDKTIDLSNKIINVTNQNINFINFNGAIVQGGIENNRKVFETSLLEQIFSDYHFDNRSIHNFEITHTPNSAQSRIEFNTNGIVKEIKIGFDKDQSSAATQWMGEPQINAIRNGDYYSNEVMLQDKEVYFDYDELDIAYRVWFDQDSNSLDTWAPQAFYQQSPNSAYPKYAGLPYGYLKSISMGFVDTNGNIRFESTLEKYAAGIYGYQAYAGHSLYKTIADIGQFRLYVNQNAYDTSIGMPNQTNLWETPYEPTPYIIPYFNNRNYKFDFRFKSRKDGWKLQVAITNPWYMLTDAANCFNETTPNWNGNQTTFWKLNSTYAWNGPGGTNNGYPPTPSRDYLFNFEYTFPDDTEANEVFGGGYPFIRAKMQTNIEKSIVDDAVWITQVNDTTNKFPVVVGMPQKSVNHKPYIFHSDSSIKFGSQARAIAKNIFNDYQKIVDADIEIEPSTFFYPSDPTKRFGIGWNVHLESPSQIVGDYKIRSITATPNNVTISLKNRNLVLSDIIDKIQKQIKDI